MLTKDKAKRLITGTVISKKMQKTVVVEVGRTYKHPTLGKVVRTKNTYKVHDEAGEAQVGDKVEIYEGRPVSKTKYMYLNKIVAGQ